MAPQTYELLNPTGGQPGLKCLFCGTISYERGDLERLYCRQCGWFHERGEEQQAEFAAHISHAHQALAAAEELADAADESGLSRRLLREAIRNVRRVLART